MSRVASASGDSLDSKSAYHRMIRPQPFAHALERKRQRQYLELGIDGNVRVEFALDRRQRGVGEFPQAIGVALRALIGPAHQQARVAKQTAVESRAALQESVPQIQRALADRGRFDFVPGIGAVQVGARPQFLLRLGLAGQQRIVIQRIEFLAAHLDGVLQAVERRLHDALIRPG